MKVRAAHCLFEHSGTFKNEFLKLGISAYDYDIFIRNLILKDKKDTEVQLSLF